MQRPTVNDIRAYRDEHGVGILDAKRTLERAWRQQRLANLLIKLETANAGERNSDLIELIDIIYEVI